MTGGGQGARQQGYGPVLRNPRFLALWLAQATSQFGDQLTRMALVLYVTETFRTPGALATILFVQLVPLLTLGPFAGVLVDRWDKKRTMIAADLVRAVLIVGMMLSRTMWELCVLAFLASTASLFFLPARGTALPEIVGRQHYMSAVSLSQVTAQTIGVAGPAVAGALIGAAGLRSAFLLDALTFLFSALVVALVPFPPLPRASTRTVPREFWRDLREGVVFVAGHTTLRFFIGLFSLAVFAFALQHLLIISYLRFDLELGPRPFSLVQSLAAAGTFLSTLLVGQFGARAPRLKLVVMGLGAAGVPTWIYFSRPPVDWVYPAAFLAGAAQALVHVPTASIMAEITPPDKRGRVFGVFGTLSHATAIPGWWLAAPLAEAFGAAPAAGAVGIFLALVSTLALRTRTYRELVGRTDAPAAAAVHG